MNILFIRLYNNGSVVPINSCMKCFVYDLSNDGIVWIGTSLPIANRLRHGLLDCEVGCVYPAQQSLYATLSGSDLDKKILLWNHKNGSIDALPSNSVNPLYTEKRRLARLRAPAVGKLILLANLVLKKVHDSPVPAIDMALAVSLGNCDVDKNVFDYSIVEYGLICGMSSQEAYKEIKLYVENMRTQKIRVHSYIEYFSKKINSITTSEQVQEVMVDIHKKFIKDSYI